MAKEKQAGDADVLREEGSRTSGRLRTARPLALTSASVEALPAEPVTALLLAREAVRADPSPTETNQLRRALAVSLERAVLGGHTDHVTSAVFMQQGRRVVTGSDDGTVRIWDAQSGSELLRLPAEIGRVVFRAVSADGERFLTTSKDGLARIWSFDGRELRRTRPADAAIEFAAFSPHADDVLTISADGKSRVWTATGTTELPAPGATVAIAASHDGLRIATVSSDGTVTVFDRTGMPSASILATSPHAVDVVFSPFRDIVVTKHTDGSARAFGFDGALIGTLPGDGAKVRSLTFDASGLWAAAVWADGRAWLWEFSKGRPADLRKDEEPVATVEIAPHGGLILVTQYDGNSRLTNVLGETLQRLEGHAGSIDCASFSPHGDLIVSACSVGIGRIWNPRTGNLVGVLRGHRDAIRSIAFSPSGDLAVTASDDQTARVWALLPAEPMTLQTPEDLAQASLTQPWIRATDGEPDPRAGRTADLVRDLRAKIGDPEARVSVSGHRDLAVVVTHVLVSNAELVQVWSVMPSLALLGTLDGHRNRVVSADFSPDGEWILTTCADKKARVWDSGTRRRVATLAGHEDALSCAAFSKQGDRIATCTIRGVTRLWSRTGATWNEQAEQIARFEADSQAVTSVCFSPKADRLMTANGANTVRIWLVEAQDLLDRADAQLRRGFTPQEKQRYGDLLEPDGPPRPVESK